MEKLDKPTRQHFAVNPITVKTLRCEQFSKSIVLNEQHQAFVNTAFIIDLSTMTAILYSDISS